MAYLSFPNIRVCGVSACVPKCVENNRESQLMPKEEMDRLISSTGIERKHVAPEGICSSDLCCAAAEKLVKELNWDKKDINALIFVSQTPDYILPCTACIIQDKLGLSNECLAFDVTLGCSGWIYGMNICSSMLSNGSIKKALLLCGDLTTRQNSYKDKTSYPLFGDAGSCTALSYEEGHLGVRLHLATDGSGASTIIIPDGGYRNPITAKSLEFVDYGDGKVMTGLHSRMDGVSVFSFAISKAPKSVRGLCEHYSIDIKSIDCFVFHQANMYLNEIIRKKLKLDADKVPSCMKDYGNTSCASLPLTLVICRKNELTKTKEL